MNYTTALTIPQGKTIKLNCIGSGLPEPTISWLRNGTILQSNLSTITIIRIGIANLSSSTLSISDSKPTDVGSYQCLLTNLFGMSVSQVIPVVILGEAKLPS